MTSYVLLHCAVRAYTRWDIHLFFPSSCNHRKWQTSAKTNSVLFRYLERERKKGETGRPKKQRDFINLKEVGPWAGALFGSFLMGIIFFCQVRLSAAIAEKKERVRGEKVSKWKRHIEHNTYS